MLDFALLYFMIGMVFAAAMIARDIEHRRWGAAELKANLFIGTFWLPVLLIAFFMWIYRLRRALRGTV